MAKQFRGVVNVDVTQSVPGWGPYTQPIAAEGTPSVLYIVLDDVGYSAMGSYGGLIETPNIDRIAQRGLTYTNFHTTVGRGHIKTQPGKFSIAGEGLNVGKDGAEAVSDDYPGQAPWPFTGGTIRRATVDVSGQPFVDLAAEARMALLWD
jgi:hypothetical protein